MLREHELARRLLIWLATKGISEATLHSWKAKYVGMKILDAKRLSLEPFASLVVRYSLSCTLSFQRREEGFHCCFPDFLRSSLRTDDAVDGHQSLELLAGVLTVANSLIEASARPGASATDLHHQGVGDELSRHGRAHRPADAREKRSTTAAI